MIFFTFDSFYKVEEFNSFVNAAKNNNVDIKLWINIRKPHYWYISVDSVQDLPKYVDFEIAIDMEEKYMIKTIDPIFAVDEYKLLRRNTDTRENYGKFVLNDYYTECYNEKSIVFFRYRNREELLKFSNTPEMKDTKLYMLGNYRNWNIAVTSNQYILGMLMSDYVLYSTDKESDFKVIGKIESYFNYKILINEKIDKKHFNTHYIMNNKYFPILDK